MSKLFHTDSVWCMCPECVGVPDGDEEPECDPDDGDADSAQEVEE